MGAHSTQSPRWFAFPVGETPKSHGWSAKADDITHAGSNGRHCEKYLDNTGTRRRPGSPQALASWADTVLSPFSQCVGASLPGGFLSVAALIMEPARKLCLLSSHMCWSQLLKHVHVLTKGDLYFTHSGDCRYIPRRPIPKREYKEHLI